LLGETVVQVERRGKYILIEFPSGTAILHLGMSGSLRVLPIDTEVKKHDHVDMVFNNEHVLRLNDPRRFGCLLFTDEDPNSHKLISKLGPEPLSDCFDAEYLFQATRKRSVAIKNFIMNSHIVVGVGNIYASEALFMAGVRPTRQAQKITKAETTKLVEAIKFVLDRSIKMGGTTLKDFTQVDGSAGYFKQKLQVYDRLNKPCRVCDAKIKKTIIGQRASYYCGSCQS